MHTIKLCSQCRVAGYETHCSHCGQEMFDTKVAPELPEVSCTEMGRVLAEELAEAESRMTAHFKDQQYHYWEGVCNGIEACIDAIQRRPHLSKRQKALAKKHGTPATFASEVYKLVPGVISMDEAKAAIETYNREWTDAA